MSAKISPFFGEDETFDRLAVSPKEFWPGKIPPLCRLKPGSLRRQASLFAGYFVNAPELLRHMAAQAKLSAWRQAILSS
jgi:hypothetical protein